MTLAEVILALEGLLEDATVPRNVKQKIINMISILKDDSLDISMRVDKLMQELDEIANDNNLQAFTRTQIWNLVSLLEKI